MRGIQRGLGGGVARRGIGLHRRGDQVYVWDWITGRGRHWGLYVSEGRFWRGKGELETDVALCGMLDGGFGEFGGDATDETCVS